MVRGWLDRGVDGFRLDVFNAFLKHPDLPSNPEQPGSTAWTRQVHVHDRDQADFVELLDRFRALVDAEPGRITIGELFDGGPERAAAMTRGHHLVFDWELIAAPWSAREFRATVERRERLFGPERRPTLVFSNHDQPRQASRLARSAGTDDVDAIAKAAAVLLVGLRGMPFLYYGEELGMVDVAIPPDEIVDPPARIAGPDFPWWNRDQCRTPMPWTAEPGAGFTTGRPWLRIGPDAARRNVAAEAADEGSVLATYRRLLEARRSVTALRRGSYESIDAGEDDVYAWRRIAPRVAGRRRGQLRWRGLPDPAAGGRGPADRRRDPPRSAGSGWRRRRHAAAIRGPHPRRRLSAGPDRAATIRPNPVTRPTGGARAARIPQAQGLV